MIKELFLTLTLFSLAFSQPAFCGNRLENKVIIVTGGTAGIGKATCLLFAREGAKVVITGKNDEDGHALVKLITKNGGTAKFWHLNTANEAEAQNVMKSVYETYGKIDGLVNNAGIGGAHKPTHELTEEEWDAIQSVNVKGVFFCTKHAIPYMKANGGGSIVNVSSTAALIASLRINNAYGASKGAVRSMSRTDAMLYVKDKIRVNSVYPALIWTPLVERIVEEGGMTRKEIGALIPMGRVGEPEEVANGILFFISDESSFITGSELVIDGGFTAL
ncbi:MAG: glucose 1-dehydrogenase [Alphaproteobacteria bacterium]|nr:glucose 1-dehydrogenase [Alphaproteobacteria bacterium]